MNNETLWNNIRTNSYQAEKEIESLTKKRTGSYYTDLYLTDVMMFELVSKLDMKSKKIYEFTFLEPCVGSGNFVFSYLKAVRNMIKTQEEAKKLINNIYVADINKQALGFYKKSLQLIVYDYWKIILDDTYFDSHIASGLVFDMSKNKIEYISIDDVFENKRFDIIATNPPYKNLKAEIKQYKREADYNSDKEKYRDIAKIVKKNFKYSNTGVLNLYKIFIEEILEKYSNSNSFISLLVPSSLLADKSCEKLRINILTNNFLHSIKIIQENNKFVNAKQALCSLLISKTKKTKTIDIVTDFCNKPNETISVKIKNIINKNNGNAIIAISENDFLTLDKLRKFPSVKDLDFIINSRGELDLTADRKYFNEIKNGIPLVRGRDIGLFSLKENSIINYVSQDFIKKTQKKEYIKYARIACQQIANIHKDRRVIFAHIPTNYILANSCNFIHIAPNKYNIDTYSILGLFNSKTINWLFKLTSTNNHINNYEIDNFPVPINSKFLEQISKKTKKYLETKNDKLLDEIEKLSILAYEL
ncbi:Alw26I/Eco31I/Esp3I family type II restriction adenine-specific DNA-methyltransferase [Helicobacter pylori]|uniref:Alw26I/Eco31I/Esp3I family type II restriction adenine-specific DNA-methyltransferase n=1 Tax=Helicobacter pylori TaxID=210 RepID=UPI0019204F18|nr:Alw26I/Eco31I/Esp3I family type II restriction adenine-specific DNA-methyltransferase [Helicobacter pylori]QQW89555.1 Alw26I/Eco31I/Esp3I family type II restriction adenine-specific DNA-methyltransferase [Helicobacter pylori]